MLVDHLPADSATVRAYNGDTEPPWTRTDHLLASVFDAVRILIWQNENQNRATPTRRPDPLPRPGVERPGTHYGKPMPLSQVKAMLPGIEQPIEVEEVG